MLTSLRSDRRRTALVDAGLLGWRPSPEPGVDRRMLERSGGEVALATSIVRFAPGSIFAPHTHGLGEEFFVLSGTFSDEGGDYPEGTYVRNPPGSNHSPFSTAGCVIFVKLRQMSADELEYVRVRPLDRRWCRGSEAGVEHALLYENSRLSVSLLRLAPGGRIPERRVGGGEEILVLDGAIEIDAKRAYELGAWTWRRSAVQRQPELRSARGALLWVKQGHL